MLYSNLDGDSFDKMFSTWKFHSSNLFSEIQKIAKLGIWELDLVNNSLIWSEELYNIFGIDPKKFGATYEAFLEIVHPEDRDAVHNAYFNSIKEGRSSYEIIHRIIRQDTEQICYIQEKCIHKRDEKGKVIKSIGIAHDITEHKRLEEKYKQLLESTVSILWEYDIKEDKWTYVSPQVEDILGYSPEEWKDFNFWVNCVHPEDRDWAIKYCQMETQEGRPHKFEYRFIKKDGSIVYLLDDVNVETFNGEAVKLRGSMVDITSQKVANQKAHYYLKEAKSAKKHLEEELEHARRVHENIFLGDTSEVDKIKNLSIKSHFVPSKRLGGDFYNFIKTEDKLIIYLSDVSGHSLDGTIISVFVKETIESYVNLMPHKITPENILEHINKQYRKDNYPHDYFLCIFLGILDLNTYELSYTGAGMQFSPIVKQKSGKCINLHSEGPPISLAIPDDIMDFRAGSTVLNPGDTVLFNTDGIAEQSKGDKIYEEKLKKVFNKYGSYPLELVKLAINQDFKEFNEGSLQGDDDITYVLLQRAVEDEKIYTWELFSNYNELEKFYTHILPVLKDCLEDDTCLQGLFEMIVNAMEHGNKFDPDKKVYIEVIVSRDNVTAIVEDEGQGFDWEAQINDCQNIRCYDERGRGILIAQVTGKRLFYNEKGNKAFFILF